MTERDLNINLEVTKLKTKPIIIWNKQNPG